MIQISIEYGKRKIDLTHPEFFNELSPGQFRAFIRYVVLPESSLEERMGDQLILMQEFLKKKIGKTFKSWWYKVINDLVRDGTIDELLKLQEFLYKEQFFYNWVLKELKAAGQIYYGPRDRFSYMTFGEFISADMLFLKWSQSKSDELLNRFIATLYKEKKDLEFSTDTISIRLPKLEKLNQVDKQGVVFNYSSVRYWLSDKYPFVFKGDDKKQEIHLGNNQSGWMSVRRNLAGDVLNLEKIDKVLLHDVLADLNEKMGK